MTILAQTNMSMFTMTREDFEATIGASLTELKESQFLRDPRKIVAGASHALTHPTPPLSPSDMKDPRGMYCVFAPSISSINRNHHSQNCGP